MTSAAIAQINVRIPADLKRSGDEALLGIGYTPSTAIRALWKLAAQRGQSLEAVASLLHEQDSPEDSADPMVAVLEGRQIVVRGLEELGINTEAYTRSLEFGGSDRELLDEARYERAVQKGWM